MTTSTAPGLAHGLWLGTLAIWVSALILAVATSTAGAIPLVLLGLPMVTYASVGALVARRDPRTVERGSGLRGMAYRMEAIGADLEVESSHGRGTTVTGWVPIPPAEEIPT